MKTLNKARRNTLAPHLNYGKMVPDEKLICGTAYFKDNLPSLIAVSWEYACKRVTVVINPFDCDETFMINNSEYTVKGRDLLII